MLQGALTRSLLLLLAPFAAARMRPLERDALWALYEATSGAQWTDNTHWTPDGDPCQQISKRVPNRVEDDAAEAFSGARLEAKPWFGVGCDDPCDDYLDGPNCTAGRVTGLNLRGNGLSGSLEGWHGVGTMANLTHLDLAYNSLVQSILFQANYFRDPEKLNDTGYKQNSQLAQWNGEGINASLPVAKANWAKTSKYIWVRGTLDTVVWPNIGEQWGALTAGYPTNLTSVPMRQTKWYLDDSFGLKTADVAGKHHFEEFAGEHIRFTMKELDAWLDKYFV